jgi:hypothetical protein
VAGSGPGNNDRILQLKTSQRSCAFYLSWFFQTFQCEESGWVRVRTADGRAIIYQDAFLLLALDAIARKLNEIRAHELWKAQQQT